MGIQYISYLLDISLKNAQQMQHFLSFWVRYSMKHGPAERQASFQIILCLFWTGSAFPHSFLSCKQSDAERNEERAKNQALGHSTTATQIRLN